MAAIQINTAIGFGEAIVTKHRVPTRYKAKQKVKNT